MKLIEVSTGKSESSKTLIVEQKGGARTPKLSSIFGQEEAELCVRVCFDEQKTLKWELCKENTAPNSLKSSRGTFPSSLYGIQQNPNRGTEGEEKQ